MRAVLWRRPGPAAEVLEFAEVPEPFPGPGQVRVAIAASGINPHDVKQRAAWLGTSRHSGAVIPHSDGAGVVEAVGEGVDPRRVGERVWLFGARGGRGTCASLCVVPQDQAVPLPAAMSFAEGACLGVPALTAHLALFADGRIAGRRVLVQGGAGAVGRAAVLFAAHAGAMVIATASTPEKREAARQAGAHHVLDSRAGDVAAQILALTGETGVDRIVEVDFGANQAVDAAVIAPHGVIAAYSSSAVRRPELDYYAFAYKAVTLRFVQANLLHGAAQAAAVAATREAVAAGWMRLPIAATFRFADTAAAHAAQEAKPAGKIIVTIP